VYRATKPGLLIRIRHWLRPLKSHLTTLFVGEIWTAYTVVFCIETSANLSIWLLPKPRNYRIFWGGSELDIATVSFLRLYLRTEAVKFCVNQLSGCSAVTRYSQLVAAEKELSARRMICSKIICVVPCRDDSSTSTMPYSQREYRLGDICLL
jgi:hypothetical protein